MGRAAVAAGVGIALVVGAIALWGAAPSGGEKRIVRYDRESRYYTIRVVDYPDRGRRCLLFSKSRGVQSSMILADPDALDLRYSRSMMAALALHPAPKEVLLVGLGGGAIPKFIQKHFPQIRLDIVEIDPDVVKVCQEWFQFKPSPTTRIIVMDGRMYLKRSAKPYDLVLLDAYAADRIPFHLTTLEFVRLVRAHLKPGGAVASNLWAYRSNRFYFAELRTFQETFPQTYLFDADDSGNAIVFGTPSEQPLAKAEWIRRAEILVAAKSIGFDLAGLVQREFEGLTGRPIAEKPLTDDLAPVDTLRRENPKTFDQQPPGAP